MLAYVYPPSEAEAEAEAAAESAAFQAAFAAVVMASNIELTHIIMSMVLMHLQIALFLLTAS